MSGKAKQNVWCCVVTRTADFLREDGKKNKAYVLTEERYGTALRNRATEQHS